MNSVYHDGLTAGDSSLAESIAARVRVCQEEGREELHLFDNLKTAQRFIQTLRSVAGYTLSTLSIDSPEALLKGQYIVWTRAVDLYGDARFYFPD